MKEAVFPSLGNTTYYVNSQTGNDSHEGTSPSRPWKSVDRVNRAIFRPGDCILFAGGQTFPGTIRLDKKSSGTDAQKIVAGTYGIGRAVINGGNDSALVADGCEHIIIANLNFLGSGRKCGNTADGIKLLRTKDVTIDQVEVSGFRGSGVMTFGDRNTRITHVYAHENGFAGIAVNSAWEATTENLYIAYCIAENNPGDPSVTDNHSGNGIVVSGVTGGVIEYCEAMNNGWDMPREGNGPVGIWGWNSDRLIIQYCISHDNKSPGLDGGGFDFDGGMTHSIMQYNLSYRNAGAAFGLYQFPGAHRWENNIVRYNISVADGSQNARCGIHIWAGGEDMSSAEIYNNIIINRHHAIGYLHDVPGLNFHDNIFITGAVPVDGPHSKSRYSDNLYWFHGMVGFEGIA